MAITPAQSTPVPNYVKIITGRFRRTELSQPPPRFLGCHRARRIGIVGEPVRMEIAGRRRDVVRPFLHHLAPLGEKVGAPICALCAIADRVRQCNLAHLLRVAGFGGPISERRAQAVHGISSGLALKLMPGSASGVTRAISSLVTRAQSGRTTGG
jgi:hypothetical protein